MIKKPPYRKLRGYAFDPSMSLEIDTASINEILYKVPWEDLKLGPEGEYVKVVDRDPTSDAVYYPVNLNEQNILANDGLDPSESNPKFHQQMVYAVSMNTIKNFEKAIGRKIQWSPVVRDITRFMKNREMRDPKNPVYVYDYVPQLILYPHAFRGANAYYSSDRKAILFGYFNATPASIDLHMPGSIVYSCLSHDIIAHEMTHAILDGMFSRFMEPTHPDVAAFHEAFADIVALFQHFTFPEVLNHEIAKTRGRFDAENLLGKLAVEFGRASGSHSSLRDGIGTTDKKNKWKRIEPDIRSYRTIFECHDRGAILVAAVFDAFITIYNRRSSDIIKVATGGTGVLPDGELNTHLVNALADEAAKTAIHVLNMCIRALDYCPPVDITFGDYLRALITADVELVEDDKHNYRIAFIDAFRKRGIYPEGINNLSVESLVYGSQFDSQVMEEFIFDLGGFLENFKNEMTYVESRRYNFNLVRSFIQGRKKLFGTDTGARKGLREYFLDIIGNDDNIALEFEKMTGLAFSRNYKKLHIHKSRKYRGKPSLEIQDIRLNNRVGPDGNIQNQVIILLVQSCGVKVKYDEDDNQYSIKTFAHNPVDDFGEGAFLFRGGCTLVFDLNVDEDYTGRLKHVINKPILDMEALNQKVPEYIPNQSRCKMQYRCQYGDYSDITGIAAMMKRAEYLAHIHQPKNKEDE